MEDRIRGVINSEHPKFASGSKQEMLIETRELLKDFYAPFNSELAHMLNDDRFLWKQ